ncbi:MAG: hydroxysqualene dehydroxylase HpnE [Rubripirellula sp.]
MQRFSAPTNQTIKPRRVIVIGGGLAGLSAAQTLARNYGQHVLVTVLESRRITGGRVGSFFDPGSKMTVDYCQHVAMGCCVNFIDFLKQCGLEEDWRVSSRLNFSHREHGLFCIKPWKWLPAPFHQLPLLWQLPFLSASQRREVQYAMLRLSRLKIDPAMKEVTAAQWLSGHGQSHKTIEDFWNVFSYSALGDHVDRVSIGSLRQLFIQGFAAHCDAADLWIPKKPLSNIFGTKLVEYLRSIGVRIQHGASVSKLESMGKGCRVVTRDGECLEGDHVVCAVPWHEINKLTDDLDGLSYLRDAASTPTSSITGIHLWFDRPLGDLDHVVGIGTAIQWIFKPCYDASNETQELTEDVGSHCFYYQVVISGSQQWASLEKKSLVRLVTDEIRGMVPVAKKARLVHSRVVTDQRAVIVPHPDVEKKRPCSTTPLPYLHLAGDWIATGWPSTMEGAVISGRQAVASIAKREEWPIRGDVIAQSRSFLSRTILKK